MPRWQFRPHATIVDEETFACVAELATRQAARLQYAVSMLTIHGRHDAGGADPDSAARQLAEVVSPVIRNTDLVGVGSAATVRVLLVGGDSENLPGIVQRIIAEASLYRVDDEPTLVVSIGGGCFPATATSSRELLLQADAMADAARRERGPASAFRLRQRGQARAEGERGVGRELNVDDGPTT